MVISGLVKSTSPLFLSIKTTTPNIVIETKQLVRGLSAPIAASELAVTVIRWLSGWRLLWPIHSWNHWGITAPWCEHSCWSQPPHHILHQHTTSNPLSNYPNIQVSRYPGIQLSLQTWSTKQWKSIIESKSPTFKYDIKNILPSIIIAQYPSRRVSESGVQVSLLQPTLPPDPPWALPHSCSHCRLPTALESF